MAWADNCSMPERQTIVVAVAESIRNRAVTESLFPLFQFFEKPKVARNLCIVSDVLYIRHCINLLAAKRKLERFQRNRPTTNNNGSIAFADSDSPDGIFNNEPSTANGSIRSSADLDPNLYPGGLAAVSSPTPTLPTQNLIIASRPVSNDSTALSLIIGDLSSAKLSLEEQLHHLSVENDTLRQQLEKSHNVENLSDLKIVESNNKNKSRQIETSNKSLQSKCDEEYEDAISNLQRMEVDLAVISAERDAFLAEVKDKSAQIGRLEEEVEELRKGSQADRDVLDRLESSLKSVDKLQDANSELVQTVDKLKDANSGLERKLAELKNVNSGLVDGFKDANSVLEQTVAEFSQNSVSHESNTILESRLFESENQLRESRARVLQLETQINEQLILDNEWPSSTADALFSNGNELDNLKEQVTQLKLEVQVLTNEAESERIRNHDLQRTISDLKASNRTHSVNSSPARGNPSGGATAVVSHLQDELSKINNQYEQEISQFDEKSHALELEINELKNYLKASEKDNCELREHIDELEETIQSVRASPATIIPSDVTVTPLVSAVSSDREVTRLKAELQSLNALFEEEAEQFGVKSRVLEIEVTELKKYLKAAEEDNIELREQIESLEKSQFNSTNPEMSLESVKMEIDELKKYLKAAEEDNIELREQIESLEAAKTAPSPNLTAFPSALRPKSVKSFTEEWDSWDNDFIPPEPVVSAVSINTATFESKRNLEKQLDAADIAKIAALEKLTVALQDRDSLQATVDTLTTNLYENESAKIDALEKLTTALQDLEQSSHEIRSLSVERDTLLQKIDVLSNDVHHLRENAAQITKEHDTLVSVKRTPVDDGEESTKILTNMEATLAKVSAERDAILVDLNARIDEIALLRENATNFVGVEQMLSLQEQYDTLSQEYSQLSIEKTKAIADSESKIIELMEENGALTQEVEQMRIAGAQVFETLQKLEEEHDVLFSEHERVLQEQESLSNAHRDVIERNKLLVGEAERINSKYVNLLEHHESVKNDFVQMNADVEQLRVAEASFVSAKKSLEAQNADLVEQLNSLKEAGAKIFQDRQAIEEEADSLAVQVDELHTQIAVFDQERITLENQISAIKLELESCHRSLQESESRAARFEHLYREIESKAANDTNELVDTLRNLTDDKADLKDQLQLLTDELNATKYENQDLTKLNSELLSKHKEFTKKLEELEFKTAQIIELERQVHSLHSQIEILQAIENERNELSEQLQSIKTEYNHLVESLEKAEFEKDALQQQLYTLQQEAQSFAVSAEDYEQVRTRLEEAETKYDQLFTDGEAHATELENQLNEALQRIENFESERGQLQYEVDFMKERLSAEEEFSAAQQTAKKSLAAEILQLRTECEQYEQRVQVLQEELMANESVLERVTAKLSTTEEQVSRVSNEFSDSRAQNAALAEELETIKHEMDQILSHQDSQAGALAELTTLRGVVDGLDQERHEAIERNKHLEHIYDEIQAKVLNLEHDLKESVELQQQLEQELDDQEHLRSEINKFKSVVSDLEGACEKLSDERDRLQRALENIEYETKKANDDLHVQYQSEITELKQRIKSGELRSDADVQIRVEQLTSALSKSLEFKNQEISEYQNRINQLTYEAEETQNRLNDAVNEASDSLGKISNLEIRLINAEERAESVENAYRNLELTYNAANAEREDFHQKLIAGAEALDVLRADLESVEERNRNLILEKDETIQNLESTLAENNRLFFEKENFMEYEKNEIFSKYEEVEIELKNNRAELDSVLSQLSEHQAVVDTLNLQVQEAAIKLEASEQERMLILADRDSQERQLLELREVETSQRTELEEFYSQNQQSNERIKALEHLVDSLEVQRAQFNNVINNETSLVEDIARKQNLIENLERELAKYKSQNLSPHSVNGSSNGVSSSMIGQNTGLGNDQTVGLLQLEIRNKEEELASVHMSYKEVVANLEEKVDSYAKLNKSSVQSMELYRDELLKKTSRLDAVEEELFALKAGGPIQETPETSMFDISKYDDAINRASKTSRTLDELLSKTSTQKSIPSLGRTEKAEILDILVEQIGSLVQSTETNTSISRKILNEVSTPARNSSDSSRGTNGQMNLIVQSQSSILEDHKRLLNDVELLSRLFKESGSSRKEAHLESSSDIFALVSEFISKVEDYHKTVAGLALTKQAVLEDLQAGGRVSVSKTVLSSLNILISGLEDVKLQNSHLSKEIEYLGSILSKYSNPKASAQLQGYNLSSREYNDLVTRAAQSERYQQQLENNNTLLSEQIREIQILKEAVDSMNAKLTTPTSNNNGTIEAQTFKMMTRQIDELKKVWSHELNTNMILRNLIAKSQAESMVAEQEARKQAVSLREEFDELATLFEESQTEVEALRVEVDKKVEEIKNSSLSAEEKFNSRLYEMEQQHIDQNQQLEDMYDKERTALNKLVANLEKERNRLLADISSLKEERSKGFENREGRKEQELLAELQHLQQQLSDERKIHERKIIEREIEWQRIRDEENMRRQLTGGDYAGDRYSDAVRIFRSQEEHLKHSLMMRDNQIQTLEIRIQELLQEQESPRRASRREIELDHELQASFSQIDDLRNQVASLDHALAGEKERSKRLIVKADDMKRKYQRQLQLLENQEESINSALKPTPRRGIPENQLYNEINRLEAELQQAKDSRNEIIEIIRETLLNTIGEATASQSTSSLPAITPRSSEIIDIMSLKAQMSSLIAEVIYLRALANRLFLWRADLKYQKVYLSLKVADLTESQRATVKFIREMGVDVPRKDLETPTLTPLQKFKAGVNVVIGVYRMMVMAHAWQDTLQSNSQDYFSASHAFELDEDAGVLTDGSVRSLSQTPREATSQFLQNRSISTTNDYSRGGFSRQQSVNPHHTTIDAYASDTSEISFRNTQSSRNHLPQREFDTRRLRATRAPPSSAQQQQQQQTRPRDPRWIVPGNGTAVNNSRDLHRRNI
ncbi:hypothetical protein HK100_007664 [Physocladia obscura]|uniref:Pericentrin/AKAP-450 centrosomal targeting domain-containing protein n=1 Tax=Physocladia obscura TaxID=109957 RepID=A0AAD5XI71_9FUNG|nr:hypothetical protein HK100_007664 [Physocladia obscura]